MEAAGVNDVLTKSLGSNNPVNIVWATLECLRGLTTVERVAELRGITVGEVGFVPRNREQ
jgi:small subunit ribosomal protein S5